MLRIATDFKAFLKKRERWFTSDLLKGFLVAFVFHAGLLVIFRIESFFDPNELPLLSPVAVEIDLSSYTSQRHLPEPVFVFPIHEEEGPITLELPDLEHKKFKETLPSLFRKEFDFSEIEKIEYKSSIGEEEEDDSD